jgi:hypothetical protein
VCAGRARRRRTRPRPMLLQHHHQWWWVRLLLACCYQLLCWVGTVVANNNPAPCFTGRQLLSNPCLLKGSNFSRAQYCNASLSLEARVTDALSHMTHPEKIGALGTVWPATPSLGLNCYNWYTEATSGIAWAHCGACRTTKFAFPITLAQSFNRSLWELTGRQIGREARALMNAGVEYSTFWAPGAVRYHACQPRRHGDLAAAATTATAD